MTAYAEFTRAYLARTGSPFGKCQEASLEMKGAFPELTIVRGHVQDAFWGLRSHWWLTDPKGTIVDPTASQFPSLLEYLPWNPGDPVRVGSCMECGAEIYRRVQDLDTPESFCDDPGTYVPNTFCSQPCEDRFVRDQMG